APPIRTVLELAGHKVPSKARAGDEHHIGVVVVIDPLDVGLGTDHPRADLVVVADLATAGEGGVVAVAEEERAALQAARNAGPRQDHRIVVAVAPAPAEVAADIE